MTHRSMAPGLRETERANSLFGNPKHSRQLSPAGESPRGFFVNFGFAK
jgi:hypothetical protein